MSDCALQRVTLCGHMQELAEREQLDLEERRNDARMVAAATAEHLADEAQRAQTLRQKHLEMRAASEAQVAAFRYAAARVRGMHSVLYFSLRECVCNSCLLSSTTTSRQRAVLVCRMHRLPR